MKQIGFIGYGLRSATMMRAFRAVEAPITVAAVADPSGEYLDKEPADAYFAATRRYADADGMLAAEAGRLDGVFIGTRCGLHTRYACAVLAAGLPVFLEKPVCISWQQHAALKAAAAGREHTALVSFPLRLSPIVHRCRQIVESGALGRITMVQAVNNVPYGSVYYHSWYRDPSLTGGLFLQKATHDIDYIAFLIGQRPVSVAARTAKMYFKGDRAPGLTCPECPERASCPESDYMVRTYYKEDVQGMGCCFAADTGNEDVASAIFTCADGLLISYSQNFVVKKNAGRRGARLIGTQGALEFDFYTGRIRVDDYRSPRTATEEYTAPFTQHFGGDEALARAFVELLEGGRPGADLSDGLASAAACLAARDADAAGRFVEIAY